MIVKHDHGRRTGKERLAEDLARVRDTRVERSDRDQAGGQQPVAGIEQHHAEALDRMRAVLRQQVLRDVAWVHEPGARARRREQRAAAKLHRGLNAAGLRATDAPHASQLIAVEPRETARAPCERQHLVGQSERARAWRAVADQHGEQLVVAERDDAALFQLLARTVMGSQVNHRRAEGTGQRAKVRKE